MAIDQYFSERDLRMKGYNQKTIPKNSVRAFSTTMHECQWVKNWSWMGVPILQLPTDMFAIQELICKIKPDLIIETGVAFGGSILFYASVAKSLGKGFVYGIDLKVKKENLDAMRKNDLGGRYHVLTGNSVGKEITDFFLAISPKLSVFVILDSKHTHKHVLKELQFYSKLVSVGSYIIVMDTSIEFLDPKYIGDRPWGKGNSPWTAVKEFMKGNEEFVIDQSIEERILLTSAPDGWLRRVK